MVCFGDVETTYVLTSEPKITMRIDERTGESVGHEYESTDMKHSAFHKRRAEGPSIEAARKSISGLLLCPFGVDSPAVWGVLHDEAVRPFERQLLPGIPFCRLRDDVDYGSLGVEWI